MSGAPIYLVSACTSGEEFVAAFRRYADRTGLFVPIREPLPAGSRGRFAVALKDGGVMIEGQAEVITSARTASVLHGRVGMTLRFVETDDASKTLLGELEKARLAMKPPPPSVQPRPAQIPAEPRPVPPPAQGRIDAINALAECVAIGDVAALGPPAAAVPVSAPPKAGPRFVVPAVPAIPPAGPGAASRPATAPNPAVAPKPSVATPKLPMASPASVPLPPGERRTDPSQPVPVISGFSQTMTAVTPLADPGPVSDTFTAATPPEPEPPAAVRPDAFAKTLVGGPAGNAAGGAAGGPGAGAAGGPAGGPGATPGAAPLSGPRRAVEMPAVQPRPVTRPHAAVTPATATPVASAPLVSAPVASAPLVSAPVASAPAGAAPAASVAPPSPPVGPGRGRSASDTPAGAAPAALVASPSPVGSGRGRSASDTLAGAAPVASVAPPSPPPSPPMEPGRGRSALDTLNAVPVPSLTPASSPTDIGGPLVEPQVGDWESLGSTHIGMPPIPRAATPASPLPAVLRPAPPIVAPPRPSVPEVEVSELTDLTPGPPEPPVAPSSPEGVSSTVPEMPLLRPRKTAIGMVIAPSGVNVPPAGAGPTAVVAAVDGDNTSDVIDVSLLMSDQVANEVANEVTAEVTAEVTGAERIVVGDSTVDASAPTLRPELGRSPISDDAASDQASPVRAGAVTPASALAAPVAPVSSPARPGGLPTGNWAIALDPDAPDGWSEPFKLVTPAPVAAEPPPVPPPAPPPAPRTPPSPPPVVASAPPRDHAPTYPTTHPDALPIDEPKVQIDPTLIEPLQAIPPDPPLQAMPPGAPLAAPLAASLAGAAVPPPSLPGYGMSPEAGGAGLPMNLMLPVPPALPFPAVQVQPAIPAGQAPEYSMDPSYGTMPMRGLPAPELFSAGGSGSGLGAQYASTTALPVQTGRRHVVIILVSALVAVLIGIVAILALRGRHSAGSPAHIDPDRDPARHGPRAAASPSSPATTPTATPTATATPPATPSPAAAPARPAAPVKVATAVPGEAGAAVAAAAVASDAAAGAAPAGADTCFADVSSVPPGAEIAIDQTNVIGTTPRKVALPCGAPVELLIRKARFVPVTRTVTPTPEGAKLKVVLAKPTFLVKVSTTPAGATVTMNGKPLGVTPTTVKIPAFELSTLTFAKEGYATETEKVTPKSNGVAVHTALKRLERKRPR